MKWPRTPEIKPFVFQEDGDDPPVSGGGLDHHADAEGVAEPVDRIDIHRELAAPARAVREGRVIRFCQAKDHVVASPVGPSSILSEIIGYICEVEGADYTRR